MKKLLIVLLALAPIVASAATQTFDAIKGLSIIAKNLSVAVTSTPSGICSVTIPDSISADAVVVENIAGTVVVCQTSPIQKPIDAVSITLPTTCSSTACWLTSNANVTITNQPDSILGSLSLNLFNGGVVTVTNGTYKGSNIVMHGLGFVETHNVTRQQPSNIYINGICTFNPISKGGGLSFGGGMSSCNGARIGGMISAGSRPAQLPAFPDISIERLMAYAAGTQTHRELPDGWSNSLPNSIRGATSYDARLKEIILAGSPLTASTPTGPQPTPQATTQPEATAPQNVPEPARNLSGETTKAPSKTPTAPQFDVSECHRVRKLMLSDSIYAARDPRGLPYAPTSYSLNAQAGAIEDLTCPADERIKLWALFLYRNCAIQDFKKIFENSSMLSQGDLHTPQTLFDAFNPEEEGSDTSSEKRSRIGRFILAEINRAPTPELLWLCAGLSGGACALILNATKNFAPHPIHNEIFRVSAFFGVLLGATGTALLKALAQKANLAPEAQAIEKQSKPKKEPKKSPSLSPEKAGAKLEKLIEFYSQLTSELATNANTFPQSLVNDVAQLKADLGKAWTNAGQAKIFLDYYNGLAEQAEVTS